MNPILAARRRAGISRCDLAIAAGTSYAQVWKAEAGYTITVNRKLAAFLESTGLMNDVQGHYSRWRSRRRKAACT